MEGLFRTAAGAGLQDDSLSALQPLGRSPSNRLRVLFLLNHAGLIRNFESTLRLLLLRGHDVHVGFADARYGSDAFDSLARENERLTSEVLGPQRRHGWTDLAAKAGSLRDYLRYLEPMYDNAPRLRDRARRSVPAPFAILADNACRGSASRRRRIAHALRFIEEAAPYDPEIVAHLRMYRPDVLVVTPLFGSGVQLSYLRAAHAQGIPSVLAVASWDNLTNKGLIREIPSVVAVWNEAQRGEAVELHHVPVDQIAVTGAPGFDEWFARRPTTSFDEFVEAAGLPPHKPLLLYVGSSRFIAPNEVEFARRWLTAVREHPDPGISRAGVLFRPHPQNALQWRGFAVEDRRATVWPPPDSAPEATGRADWSRAQFFDSLYHADAVIGINTTAMIESAILGRPVLTVVAAEARQGQEGTIHFRHLVSREHGLVYSSRSLDEHIAQLQEVVTRSDDRRSRAFVASFVRPRGLDLEATPFLVDTIERAAAAVVAAKERQVARAARAALAPVVALATVSSRLPSPKKRRRLIVHFGRRLRRLVFRLVSAIMIRVGLRERQQPDLGNRTDTADQHIEE